MHDHGELEHLAGNAFGYPARGPIQNRPVLVALDVTAVAGPHRRTGGAVYPLGLDHLGAVVAHLGDVTDEIPDPLGRRIDVDGDGSAHSGKP